MSPQPRIATARVITLISRLAPVLWSGLTVFLTDPRIPIHNNHAEREIRGVVVGRKNHYGSKSKRSTEVAAIFYRLFESARLAGVDPSAYLLETARHAIRKPGAVTLPVDLLGQSR